MNNFQQASSLERKKMEAIFAFHNITNYKFTDELGYARYDGEFVNSKGESIIFEVKVRNVTSTKYKTTVIEQSKYDYLITQSKKAYVFVFFTDDTYMMHYLNASNNYKKSQMYAPRTTAANTGHKVKDFIEIPITKLHTLSTN